jgi:transcriptional regulator with XRE-family HTH domain
MNYKEAYDNRIASESAGQYLKNLRLANKFSLQDLCDATGGIMSKSRLSNYEQGTRRMSTEVAVILADALGASPAQILRLED